jgi:hypothetical protein
VEYRKGNSCEKLWKLLAAGTWLFCRADRKKTGVCQIGGAGAMTAMHACSACAGNYEDPDRTAWAADDPDDEEAEEETRGASEKFPAQD